MRSRHHRRRGQRRLRRSNWIWLLLGVLVSAPLFVGAMVIAHFNMSPAPPPEASPDRPAAAAAQSVAAALCAAPEAEPRNAIESAACGKLSRLREALAEPGMLSQTDPRPAFAGRGALHHAALRGDLAAVKLLLEAGASPDLADAQGNTPLHLLTIGDKVALDEGLAQALIGAGADVSRRNRRGLTALEALEADHRRVLASPALARLLQEAENRQAMAREAQRYLAGKPAQEVAVPDDGIRIIGE